MGSITINAQSYTPNIIGRDTGYGNSSTNACGYISRLVIYYDSNYTFATVPVIWLNANETGVPTIGWYSLDAIARYWDGTSFTGSVVCVNASPISLKAGGTLVGSCAQTSQIFYVAGGQTFATMTAIYTDAALTILAGNGYYSNGTDVRLWNAPTMGAAIPCIFSTTYSLGEGISSGSACTDVIGTTYYINNAYTFLTTPAIYQDVDLLIPVLIGWYSDGTNARYWNGSSLGTAIACNVGTYTLYNLKTNGVLAGTCTSGVIRPTWILATETFSTATQIWNNNDGTGVPPIGYYSFGLEVRYWNGTVLGPVQVCPTATTSILLNYGLTAQASCDNPTASEFWFPTVDTTWSNASSVGTVSSYLSSPEVPPASGFYTDSAGTTRQWDSITRSFLGTTFCSPVFICAASVTIDVTEAGTFDFTDCDNAPRSAGVGVGIQTLNYSTDGCMIVNTQAGSAMYTIIEWGPQCAPPPCYSYIAGGTNVATVIYIDCNGVEQSAFYDGPSASGYTQINFCGRSIVDAGLSQTLINEGPC